MKPSVGRIVHYQSYGTPGGEYTSQPRAAVVTIVTPHQSVSDTEWTFWELNNETNYTVGLCILNPTGQFFTADVKYSAEPKAGCWNWPPKI